MAARNHESPADGVLKTVTFGGGGVSGRGNKDPKVASKEPARLGNATGVSDFQWLA